MEISGDGGVYRVLKKIAEGEFAEIFLVENSGNQYALKKLKNYLKHDREFTSVLEKEGELLARLADREHFPALKHEGECGGEKFLIMELLDGVDLGRIVQLPQAELPPLPIVARIVLEIARGLQSLHSHPSGKCYVHGDLRPSNVMATREGQVKLIDLGQKGGTFIYMPLERMHSREITAYTDLYALGHLFFELTHGQHLYRAGTKQETYFEMRENPVRPEHFSARLPVSWHRVLFDLLQQEEKPRYRQAKDLVSDLETILRENIILASPRELAEWVRLR